MIGEPPRMVAVPTHFFKVVLAERNTMLGQQARCFCSQVAESPKLSTTCSQIAMCTQLTPVNLPEPASWQALLPMYCNLPVLYDVL
jgi:hypothetical protein